MSATGTGGDFGRRGPLQGLCTRVFVFDFRSHCRAVVNGRGGVFLTSGLLAVLHGRGAWLRTTAAARLAWRGGAGALPAGKIDIHLQRDAHEHRDPREVHGARGFW